MPNFNLNKTDSKELNKPMDEVHFAEGSHEVGPPEQECCGSCKNNEPCPPNVPSKPNIRISNESRTDDYTPASGYIMHDKTSGKKIKRWVGLDGTFQEKVV
ncbi:MAG: hypothetical protein KAS32_26075 [Candidatus Peribacteraceae bacterium]|nr:hypothetical protein [Candidatus Peribacteraceae bacterium]